ncbi:unnamed protein product [Linum trigynum]|uniref:Uncharacterized protein n=1 Tax=Linum trigynum TaxID=586398 RepID=A0AAV2FCF4_9ROSI
MIDKTIFNTRTKMEEIVKVEEESEEIPMATEVEVNIERDLRKDIVLEAIEIGGFSRIREAGFQGIKKD